MPLKAQLMGFFFVLQGENIIVLESDLQVFQQQNNNGGKRCWCCSKQSRALVLVNFILF